MNYSKLFTSTLKIKFLLAILVISGLLTSCSTEPEISDELSEFNLNVNSANSVKITSTGLNFDAPEEIPSGWTNFQYMNETGMTHFFILIKLPEGKDLEDYKAEVSPPFQAGMNFWRVGDIPGAFGPEGFGGLPGWYGETVITGGSGLISPYLKSNTTLEVTPGNYVIECYVKSPGGEFHSYNGMIDAITVTEENNTKREPESNIDINISTANGIELMTNISRPGNHTFGVNFTDQTAYGNLLGHDVHLVRFENGFSDEQKMTLNNWMNWLYVGTDLEGLMAPVPEGFTFLGGIQEMPSGSKGYFNATLTKGDYALIAEVDDPVDKDLYIEFTIE